MKEYPYVVMFRYEGKTTFSLVEDFQPDRGVSRLLRLLAFIEFTPSDVRQDANGVYALKPGATPTYQYRRSSVGSFEPSSSKRVEVSADIHRMFADLMEVSPA